MSQTPTTSGLGLGTLCALFTWLTHQGWLGPPPSSCVCVCVCVSWGRLVDVFELGCETGQDWGKWSWGLSWWPEWDSRQGSGWGRLSPFTQILSVPLLSLFFHPTPTLYTNFGVLCFQQLCPCDPERPALGLLEPDLLPHAEFPERPGGKRSSSLPHPPSPSPTAGYCESRRLQQT